MTEMQACAHADLHQSREDRHELLAAEVFDMVKPRTRLEMPLLGTSGMPKECRPGSVAYAPSRLLRRFRLRRGSRGLVERKRGDDGTMDAKLGKLETGTPLSPRSWDFACSKQDSSTHDDVDAVSHGKPRPATSLQSPRLHIGLQAAAAAAAVRIDRDISSIEGTQHYNVKRIARVHDRLPSDPSDDW
jgi:hypothetical protein